MEIIGLMFIVLVANIFLVGRYPLVPSILFCCCSIAGTNISFPFWTIYSPKTSISLTFIMVAVGIPIIFLNIGGIQKISANFYKKKITKVNYLSSLTFLMVGLMFFGIGLLHNTYQSDPETNLKLYLKEREHIVRLIKSGVLHGESNCLQAYELYGDKWSCQDTIVLPEGYQGLSRNGYVKITKNQDQLTIAFLNHTYQFGDGSAYIIYSSSENGTSLPKWYIKVVEF